MTSSRQRPSHATAESSQNGPVHGQRLDSSIDYRADGNIDTVDKKFYYGLTENTFKQRYNGHITTFRHELYEKNTELSKHVYKVKRAGKPHPIAWSTARSARAYSSSSKRCDLCLTEKLFIASADKARCLNERSELVS